MTVKKIQVLTALVLGTFTCLLLPFLFLFSFLHTFLMVSYEKSLKHTVTIHFSFTSLTMLLMAFDVLEKILVGYNNTKDNVKL